MEKTQALNNNLWISQSAGSCAALDAINAVKKEHKKNKIVSRKRIDIDRTLVT